jgi:hypothetical protein
VLSPRARGLGKRLGQEAQARGSVKRLRQEAQARGAVKRLRQEAQARGAGKRRRQEVTRQARGSRLLSSSWNMLSTLPKARREEIAIRLADLQRIGERREERLGERRH